MVDTKPKLRGSVPKSKYAPLFASTDRSVSLLRALATADHYRYFVPSEGHELEINAGPYRLLGWLKNPETRDSGIDDHDTFRADMKPYGDIPGSVITKKLGLQFQWPATKLSEMVAAT